MANKGKLDYRKISPKQRKALQKELLLTLTKLGMSKDAATFLNDLLTRSEIIMLARRIQIAKRLLLNHSFEEIKRDIHVGLATIRLVNTQQYIADLIGCSQSTVSKELRRNRKSSHWRYNADHAQQIADKRREEAKKKCSKWHNDPVVLKYVIEELRDDKSPDQISGRMKRVSPYLQQHAVSHQTIYNYINRIRAEGGCLHRYLLYQGKKHKWHGYKNSGRGMIPNRNDISERPKEVDQKKRCGDWESDLVVGKHQTKQAVATFVERYSMYFKAVLVADQSAEEMVRATHDALGDIPEEGRRTMTHDNGKEIAKHEQITEELSITVYCATPYHSWERGLNEYMNRELRRYFPKGTDFGRVTQRKLDTVVEKLNNRPRRSLNYLTPKEVFLWKIKGYAFQSL